MAQSVRALAVQMWEPTTWMSLLPLGRCGHMYACNPSAVGGRQRRCGGLVATRLTSVSRKLGQRVKDWSVLFWPLCTHRQANLCVCVYSIHMYHTHIHTYTYWNIQAYTYIDFFCPLEFQKQRLYDRAWRSLYNYTYKISWTCFESPEP